jgi:hypothetical protein
VQPWGLQSLPQVLSTLRLPIRPTGKSGRQRNSCLTSWLPRLHHLAIRKGKQTQSPVAPIIVVCLLERGPTSWVTTECSVPVSTMRSMGWPPIFIQTIGFWGPSRMEPSLS